VDNKVDTAREWVQEAEGRVLFLLGAGASKPALPVSAELTAIVLEGMDRTLEKFAADSRVPQLWTDIRPVIESMGSNIEDVYQAVQTLTYQASDPTRFWVESFADFPSYDGDREELAQDADLTLHMILKHTLNALDNSQAEAPLDHFLPLLQAAKTGVVTLNYDQLIERAGARFNLPVSTGAEQWDGSVRWAFEPNSVPLLKLHGSMTWRSSRSLNMESGNLVPAMGFYETGGLNEAAPNNLLTPTVIFGAGSKASPFSAFPALTRKLHDWLDESELLIVVGYSFRDQHVDAAIHRWASLAPNRRIVVIDPYPRRDLPMNDGVLSSLLWAMDAEYRPRGVDALPAAASIGPNRMLFLTGSVEVQIPSLLA